MKQLIRKKWFRILARTVVVVATLLLLAVSLFNWQAAKRKERAIIQAKAAGMTLVAADLATGMPPDELNFARHGIFATLEDGLAIAEDMRSPEQRDAIARYEALGDPELLEDLNQNRRYHTGPIDFSLLPDDGSHGKTAESFLAEYDRRHGDVLAEIRAAMALPEARRAPVPEDLGSGDDWLQMNESFGITTIRVQRGLRLRAEAALVTGDSAKAAETLEMIARLGELNGSRGSLISAMIEFASYGLVSGELKRGMKLEAWTIQDLDRISAAAARWDIRARLISAASAEATMVQVYEAWKHDRSRITPYLAADFSGEEIDLQSGSLPARIAAELLPNGVFDRAAAVSLEDFHTILLSARNPAPAAAWLKTAAQLRAHVDGDGPATSLLNGSSAGAAFLRAASRALLRRQLILAACAIERHRLANGAYPENLSGFPLEVTADPLLGGLLVYERTDKGFRLFTPGPPATTPDGMPDPMPRSPDLRW